MPPLDMTPQQDFGGFLGIFRHGVQYLGLIANALQGASGGGGTITGNITTVTVNTTIGVNNCTLLCDAAAAPITITLIAPSSIKGRFLYIKKIDTTANAVTISGFNIDAGVSWVLNAQGEVVEIQPDGTQYWVVAI